MSSSDSATCSRCSMKVPLDPSGLGTGTCPECKSWRCPLCSVFMLARDQICDGCREPKSKWPPYKASSASSSSPSPTPASSSSSPTSTSSAKVQNNSSNSPATTPTPRTTPPPATSPVAGSSNTIVPTSSSPWSPSSVVVQGVVITPAQVVQPPSSQRQQQNQLPHPRETTTQQFVALPYQSAPPRPQQQLNNNSFNKSAQPVVFDASGDAAVAAERQWQAEVEEKRNLCRIAGTPFVNFLNDEERKKYEWASVIGPDAQLRSSAPDGKWTILPKGGVSASSQVVQGQLGVCFFLSAIAVLSYKRPDLIEALFPLREINPEGVFVVKLWMTGRFRHFIVDGTFPVRPADGGGMMMMTGGAGVGVGVGVEQLMQGLFGIPSSSRQQHRSRVTFRFGRCADGSSLFCSLLEKTFASKYGAYEALTAGLSSEAFYDLTGFPCLVIHLSEKEFDETEMKTPEELFQVLESYSTSQCVMAASCGGRKQNKDQIALSMNLRHTHAYSLLMATRCSRTRQKMVLLRDPWAKTECNCREQQPPAQFSSSSSSSPGEFWLDFERFRNAFDNVTACITRPFTQRIISKSATCRMESCFLPQRFSEGGILFEARQTTEIYFMVCQEEIRVNFSDPTKSNGAFYDIAAFLLRLPSPSSSSSSQSSQQNNNKIKIPKLVAVAGFRDLRVAWSSHVVDPGFYLLLPASMQQSRATNKELVTSILTEHATAITPLAINDNQQLMDLVLRTSNRWFFSYVAEHRKCETKQNAVWISHQLSIGESRVVAITSLTKRDSAISVDASSNTGVYHGFKNATAGNCNLVLPGMHASLIYWSVAEPFGASGTMVIDNGSKFGMKEIIDPKSAAVVSGFFGGPSSSRTATAGGDRVGQGYEELPVIMKPFMLNRG